MNATCYGEPVAQIAPGIQARVNKCLLNKMRLNSLELALRRILGDPIEKTVIPFPS